MTLGEQIASLRKKNGLSQDVLADNCKVSLRTIQRIESNASTPRPHTLKVIADALAIPVDMLAAHTELPAASRHDLNQLRYLNLLAIVGIVVPLLNIFLPVLAWRRNASLPLVKKVGGRIISFQIWWTLTAFVLLAIARIAVGVTGSVAIGKLPPTLPSAYVLLAIVNIAFILRASWQLSRGDARILYFCA